MRTSSAVLVVLLAAGFACASSAACGAHTDDVTGKTLTGAALHDPNNCLPCHTDQFKEWSGSMHAYAADDPLFLAMNKRMQREGTAPKEFCVSCHAPTAFRLGLTTDGLNLSSVPSAMRGVTCWFCHTADRVDDSHNNPLHLANDDTLRGGIHDPFRAMPHNGAYSPLHDREVQDSASMCGACHDVISPHGAKIERTFAEWTASLYAKPGQLSCGKCHMDGRDGVAAHVDGAPARRVHAHSMPGVDVALTEFPDTDAQRNAVQMLLDNALIAKLCVKQTPLGITADVTLDDAFAGHAFPSGANQDRRAWVELVATRDGSMVFASGAVADDASVASLADPNIFLLRDTMFDDSGKETRMFWESSRVSSSQLTAAVTNDPLDPRFIHSTTKSFGLPTPTPDKVTMRVRMRPFDFDLVDDLVTSGDLDPSYRAKVPSYVLGSTVKEWTLAGGFGCIN